MIVRAGLLALLLASASVLGAADKTAEIPVLGGTEEYGRVFLWQDGTKLFLTPPWERNVLGGGTVTGDKEPTYFLWGWTIEPPRVRFWTLSVVLGKPGKPGEVPPVQSVEFARDDFGVEGPDLAAKVDDRLALVYGALTTSPRWELWNAGTKQRAKAWDDGRTYSAVALSPSGELALAARSAEGHPFLETAEGSLKAPAGLIGRLATVGWNGVSEPASWVATGWGAFGGAPPAFLALWHGEWVSAFDSTAPDPKVAGVLPGFAALTPAGDLLVVGRQVRTDGAEALWVWEPTGSRTLEAPEGAAVSAFAAAGEAGWTAVVRTPQRTWSLVTDQGVTELAGLRPGDRVTFISPPVAPAKQ